MITPGSCAEGKAPDGEMAMAWRQRAIWIAAQRPRQGHDAGDSKGVDKVTSNAAPIDRQATKLQSAGVI